MQSHKPVNFYLAFSSLVIFLLLYSSTCFAEQPTGYSRSEIDTKLKALQDVIDVKLKVIETSQADKTEFIAYRQSLDAKHSTLGKELGCQVQVCETRLKTEIEKNRFAGKTLGEKLEFKNEFLKREGIKLSWYLNFLALFIASVGIGVPFLLTRKQRLEYEIAVNQAKQAAEDANAHVTATKSYAKDAEDLLEKAKPLLTHLENEKEELRELKSKFHVGAFKVDDDSGEEDPIAAKVAAKSKNLESFGYKLEAKDFMAQAYDYFKKKQYEEALETILKAISINPNGIAWNNMGTILVYLKRHEEALAAYEKSVELEPDDYRGSMNIASALSALGRYDEAIVVYEKAVKIEPNSVGLLTNMGNTLSAMERHEEALSVYEKAVELDPDDHGVLINMGNTLSDLERYEEALVAYEKAVKIKPDDYRAWMNTGNTLGDLERYEEALVAYKKAVKIKPDDYRAWTNTGNTLDDLERYEEALVAYEKAVKIKPDDYRAWVNMGLTLGELERHEEALSAYEKAVKIKPDNHMGWTNMGLTLSDLERYEEALVAHEKALKNKPDSYGGWVNMGLTLRAMERHEEALSAYEKAVKIKPDDHRGWANMGLTLSDLERYEEALAVYEKSLKIKPDDHRTEYNIACLFALQNDKRSSLESLTKAINLNESCRENFHTDPDFKAYWNDADFLSLTGTPDEKPE